MPADRTYWAIYQFSERQRKILVDHGLIHPSLGSCTRSELYSYVNKCAPIQLFVANSKAKFTYNTCVTVIEALTGERKKAQAFFGKIWGDDGAVERSGIELARIIHEVVQKAAIDPDSAEVTFDITDWPFKVDKDGVIDTKARVLAGFFYYNRFFQQGVANFDRDHWEDPRHPQRDSVPYDKRKPPVPSLIYHSAKVAPTRPPQSALQATSTPMEISTPSAAARLAATPGNTSVQSSNPPVQSSNPPVQSSNPPVQSSTLLVLTPTNTSSVLLNAREILGVPPRIGVVGRASQIRSYPITYGNPPEPFHRQYDPESRPISLPLGNLTQDGLHERAPGSKPDLMQSFGSFKYFCAAARPGLIIDGLPDSEGNPTKTYLLPPPNSILEDCTKFEIIFLVDHKFLDDSAKHELYPQTFNSKGDIIKGCKPCGRPAVKLGDDDQYYSITYKGYINLMGIGEYLARCKEMNLDPDDVECNTQVVAWNNPEGVSRPQLEGSPIFFQSASQWQKHNETTGADLAIVDLDKRYPVRWRHTVMPPVIDQDRTSPAFEAHLESGNPLIAPDVVEAWKATKAKINTGSLQRIIPPDTQRLPLLNKKELLESKYGGARPMYPMRGCIIPEEHMEEYKAGLAARRKEAAQLAQAAAIWRRKQAAADAARRQSAQAPSTQQPQPTQHHTSPPALPPDTQQPQPTRHSTSPSALLPETQQLRSPPELRSRPAPTPGIQRPEPTQEPPNSPSGIAGSERIQEVLDDGDDDDDFAPPITSPEPPVSGSARSPSPDQGALSGGPDDERSRGDDRGMQPQPDPQRRGDQDREHDQSSEGEQDEDNSEYGETQEQADEGRYFWNELIQYANGVPQALMSSSLHLAQVGVMTAEETGLAFWALKNNLRDRQDVLQTIGTQLQNLSASLDRERMRTATDLRLTQSMIDVCWRSAQTQLGTLEATSFDVAVVPLPQARPFAQQNILNATGLSRADMDPADEQKWRQECTQRVRDGIIRMPRPPEDSMSQYPDGYENQAATEYQNRILGAVQNPTDSTQKTKIGRHLDAVVDGVTLLVPPNPEPISIGDYEPESGTVLMSDGSRSRIARNQAALATDQSGNYQKRSKPRVVGNVDLAEVARQRQWEKAEERKAEEAAAAAARQPAPETQSAQPPEPQAPPEITGTRNPAGNAATQLEVAGVQPATPVADTVTREPGPQAQPRQPPPAPAAQVNSGGNDSPPESTRPEFRRPALPTQPSTPVAPPVSSSPMGASSSGSHGSTPRPMIMVQPKAGKSGYWAWADDLSPVEGGTRTKRRRPSRRTSGTSNPSPQPKRRRSGAQATPDISVPPATTTESSIQSQQELFAILQGLIDGNQQQVRPPILQNATFSPGSQPNNRSRPNPSGTQQQGRPPRFSNATFSGISTQPQPPGSQPHNPSRPNPSDTTQQQNEDEVPSHLSSNPSAIAARQAALDMRRRAADRARGYISDED